MRARGSVSAQNQVSEFSETFLFLCISGQKPPPSTCGKVLRISPISAALAVATTVWIASGEKKFRLFLFLLPIVRLLNLPADVVKLYIRKARESLRTRTVEALW